MEEVDTIIFPIIRDIGCALPENISAIKELQPQHVYNIASTCLNTINPQANLRTDLPPQKAAQFRVASTLSQAIKELGFTGEMGYQNVLYPNESDLRRLLSFLLEKLPRSDKGETESAVNVSLDVIVNRSLKSFASKKHNVLNHFISSSSRNSIAEKYASIAFISHPVVIPSKNVSKQSQQYFSTYQLPLSSQVPRANLSASVFEYLANASINERKENEKQFSVSAESQQARAALRDAFNRYNQEIKPSNRNQTKRKEPTTSNLLVGASTFARKTDFTQEAETNLPTMTKAELDEQERLEAERLEAERAAAIEEMQKKIEDAQAQQNHLHLALQSSQKSSDTLKDQIRTQEEKLKAAKDALTVKQRVVSLLPEAEANVKKLQQLADEGAMRLLELAEGWNNIRDSLLSTYREAKIALKERRGLIEAKQKELQHGRTELRSKIAEARERDEFLRQVVDELNSLPKTVSRQVFIRRISDIVRNLDRQREEIQRILSDVRLIQKELNAKTESVKRSFDVADDLVYQRAKLEKDPTAISVYRNIVQLQQGFAAIIDAIEKTGKKTTEASELQQDIDNLEARLAGLNFDTVTADLVEMKQETKQLRTQIKRLQKQTETST